ncbi:hypothetical protein [Sphingomonas sp.]|uniref:hypothetical protein n=1 Tax=Sphingomonas sp. TaxID=28214 RepID=UPI001B06304A|nr:hypothetical protein [Sphingomonas sp.]MBO9713747.1 hypothetical protein [Sphingomonas sp.]
MAVRPTLPLISLAAALALAGCNQAPQTTDNALVNVENATDLGDTPENDEVPVIENVAAGSTEAVAVAALPKPAANTPATDAAPLAEASTIETDIREARGIQRVRYGEGWAWMQGGRIVRTADRDGRNIAYFRRGEDKPFLVQRGDRAFAYQGDKPVREFDHDGRATRPDAGRSREAEDAAKDARAQHGQAEQARDHARRPDDRRGSRDDHASPTPTPSPSPSPTRSHDRPDRGRPGQH